MYCVHLSFTNYNSPFFYVFMISALLDHTLVNRHLRNWRYSQPWSLSHSQIWYSFPPNSNFTLSFQDFLEYKFLIHITISWDSTQPCLTTKFWTSLRSLSHIPIISSHLSYHVGLTKRLFEVYIWDARWFLYVASYDLLKYNNSNILERTDNLISLIFKSETENNTSWATYITIFPSPLCPWQDVVGRLIY